MYSSSGVATSTWSISGNDVLTIISLLQLPAAEVLEKVTRFSWE